jgi:hypothetical protein
MAEWNKSQQRGETVDPHNPPKAVTDRKPRMMPAFAVPGMWYYLAPIGIIVLIIVMAMMFWMSRQEVNEGAVPTTGIEQESPAHQDTPGGINPDPRHDTTESEQEFRGGDQR